MAKVAPEVISLPSPVLQAYPIPSCHAVIVDEAGAVLLVQRRKNPFRGYWGLPGGKVELGETVTAALTREVQEETGLLVTSPRLVTYRDAVSVTADGKLEYHFVMFYFVASVAGGRLRAGDDADAVRWVRPAELKKLPLVPELKEILAAARLPETPFR